MYDIIALPGGLPGAEYLRDSIELDYLIKDQLKSNRILGAICASPAVVLGIKNLLTNYNATCYPACKNEFIVNYVNERVVVDRNLITSQGPGTALEFAIKIVEVVLGKIPANDLKNEMLIKMSEL